MITEEELEEMMYKAFVEAEAEVGSYAYNIIIKSLHKSLNQVKNNGVLDDVMVTDCPKCNYKLHPSGQCVNQLCSGWSKKSLL